MRLYIIVGLLMLIVLFSACIGGRNVEVDQNNGLRINEFSVDPYIVEYDDLVTFSLDIENVGGTTARFIKAELFGLDSWYDINGNPLSIPLLFGNERFGFSFNQYDGNLRICYGGGLLGDALSSIFNTDVRTGELFCYSRTREGEQDLSFFVRSSWDEFSAALYDSYTSIAFDHPTMKLFPELAPPYPVYNRPGQFVTAEWNFYPPELPQGLEVDYPVTARVTYDYTSTAVISLRAFNKAEYKRRQDQGDPLLYPAEIVNSYASPIKVALISGSSPVVVNQQAIGAGLSAIELVPLKIEFQNLGDGFPLPVYNDVGGESGLVFGTIEARGPGVFFYDCLGEQHMSGEVASDELFVWGQLAKLRSDNRAPFGCTLGIERVSWVNRPTDTISLIFDLHYIYYIDKEISVKVLGLEEPYI